MLREVAEAGGREAVRSRPKKINNVREITFTNVFHLFETQHYIYCVGRDMRACKSSNISIPIGAEFTKIICLIEIIN